MSQLRWIERDGRQILQQIHLDDDTRSSYVWSDVPTHQEPKKVTVEHTLAEALNNASMANLPYQMAYLREAKAAIEFFKARMPKPLPGYEDAFKDVRQALFGEE